LAAWLTTVIGKDGRPTDELRSTASATAVKQRLLHHYEHIAFDSLAKNESFPRHSFISVIRLAPTIILYALGIRA